MIKVCNKQAFVEPILALQANTFAAFGILIDVGSAVNSDQKLSIRHPSETGGESFIPGDIQCEAIRPFVGTLG